MKFSIVVPFYNVEKYIKKCIDSIINQSYKNFELIIINDGSKEKEEKIIKKYLNDNRIKYLVKDNGGLSDARNYGIKEITGDYLLFIDSDDYIEKDLLKKINDILLNKKVDILKFGLKIVNENGDILNKSHINASYDSNKNKVIKNILKDEYIDPACIYTYKVSFWKENKFKFAKQMIHEDFGLIPLILDTAKSIINIDYWGYNYLQRNSSIMQDISYNKIQKRVEDFKKHYMNHKEKINNKDLLGYVSFATIIKGRELNDIDRKDYIKFIKKEKLINKITTISFKRLLIKMYLYLFLERYLTKLNKEFYGGKNV